MYKLCFNGIRESNALTPLEGLGWEDTENKNARESNTLTLLEDLGVGMH